MKQQHVIALIMIAVIAWGVFLSVGAWRESHDWRRPAITMVCVVGFLVFWGLMLMRRRAS